jgi:tetratricopeptide (TPR) repeat protein
MSLGYRNLVSDMLWFKTVQYYGGFRLGKNSLRLFRHLITVITDLDPQFTFAYQLGAVIMAEDMNSFEEGRKILQKGIENNPDNWRLTFEMGFLHYITGRDYDLARQYFTMASQMPGANERALRFAASAAARGNDPALSIKMWEKLAENTEEEFMRDLAEKYIEKLEKRLAEMEGS